MLRWKLAFYYLNMKEYRWLGKHLLSKKKELIQNFNSK